MQNFPCKTGMCVARCEEGSKLLLKMIQLVANTLSIYKKLPYNDDKNSANLAKALDELEKEYLKEHLRRSVSHGEGVPQISHLC